MKADTVLATIGNTPPEKPCAGLFSAPAIVVIVLYLTARSATRPRRCSAAIVSAAVWPHRHLGVARSWPPTTSTLPSPR